jgi:hypothetical protein
MGRVANGRWAATSLALITIVGAVPGATHAQATATAGPALGLVGFRPGLTEGTGVHRRVGTRAGANGETPVALRPATVASGHVIAHAGLTYRLTADHHLDVHTGRSVTGAGAPFAGIGLTTRF